MERKCGLRWLKYSIIYLKAASTKLGMTENQENSKYMKAGSRAEIGVEGHVPYRVSDNSRTSDLLKVSIIRETDPST